MRTSIVIIADEGTHCYTTHPPNRLVKAGVLPTRFSPGLTKASAWAEAIGYVASITLNALRVAALLEREHALVTELCRMTRV